MFFLKKASSDIAVNGAMGLLADAKTYLSDRQHEHFIINEMSKRLFEIHLEKLGILQIISNDHLFNQFSGPISESTDADLIIKKALLSYDLYTPEFHRSAHQIKKLRNKFYQPATAEWISSNISLAACSILGALPETPEREDAWALLETIWGFEEEKKDTSDIVAEDELENSNGLDEDSLLKEGEQYILYGKKNPIYSQHYKYHEKPSLLLSFTIHFTLFIVVVLLLIIMADFVPPQKINHTNANAITYNSSGDFDNLIDEILK
ncbi:hypothetical protein [Neptuniibacter marinus]|uniref:hypothetical protein n=1 Tax=Neptuniibacter marinus TaxID=1806670 RepID=UPI003B5A4850